MTSDNVEVGVLRLEPPATKSPLIWRACPLPANYQLVKFRGAGVGIRLFVHADLNADGIIRGRILGTKIASGTWNGELAWPDGRERSIAATVRVDGSFTANAAEIKDVLISTGLQLALREPASERIAVGWVNQHAMLQAGRRGFLSPSTFLRFMSDSANTSDDAALLRYIAASMTQLLDVFTAPSTARNTQPEHVESTDDETNATRTKKYGAQDLAPTDFTSHSLDQFGSDAAADARAIKYLMRTLRYRLLERTERDEEAREQSDASERGDEDDESDETAIAADEAASAATDMVAYFDEQVRQLISRATSPMTRGAIFSTWLEIVLPHLTKQAMAPDGPRRFVRDWFALATSEQEKPQSPPSLIEYVTSAGLFLVASEKNADPIEPDQILRTIAFVHERLARFSGHDVTADVLRESAVNPLQWPAIFTRKVLSWRQPLTPETTLQCVMAVPTFAEQLELIKGALLTGSKLPDGLPIERTKAGRLLIAESTQRRRLPEVCRQAVEGPICPSCHLRMSVSIQADLRQEHLAQCDNCSRFVARAR
jgi:hypothetical protein